MCQQTCLPSAVEADRPGWGKVVAVTSCSTHLSLQPPPVRRLSLGTCQREVLPELSHLLLQLRNLQVHLLHFPGELVLDSVQLQGSVPQLGTRQKVKLGGRAVRGRTGACGARVKQGQWLSLLWLYTMIWDLPCVFYFCAAHAKARRGEDFHESELHPPLGPGSQEDLTAAGTLPVIRKSFLWRGQTEGWVR